MNLVFDFAGVVFHWRPAVLLARLLPGPAVTPDMFFEGYGGDWGEFDRGTLGAAELAQRIATRTGLPLDEVQRVIDAVPAELQPDAEMVALLDELHALGRPLFFLSNMPEPYARHLEDRHHFLERFHAGVFSARAGLVKPEPQIYAHAAGHFGIDPAATLFFDDLEVNVVAARAAGWQALQFESAAQCRAELAARGLL